MPSPDPRWLPMKTEAAGQRTARVGFVDLSRAPLAAIHRDNTGLWRAEAAEGRLVTLRRENKVAMAVTLPAAPAEAGTIETLFPFPDHGWLFASNGSGSLVAWHRDTAGGWQAPFVLDAATLREARGPYAVGLADAGRTLVLDGPPIARDAEWLLNETKRLASARSGDPTPPAMMPCSDRGSSWPTHYGLPRW